MLVMFWAILLDEDDSYDLDNENPLTLSPLSLLRQSILFMSGRGRGRGGRGRGSAQPLVAMLMMLILMFSPLLHLPDLGLVTKVEVMAVYTKMVLLLMGRMAMSMALLTLT